MSKLLEQINTAPRITKKLGDVFEIVDGDRGANYPSKTEFTKSGYCVFLNTKNVPSSGFDFSNIDFISKERDELLRKGKLNRNDIVMTTRGTIGNVAIYTEDFPFNCIRINSGMVILRSKPSYDRTYLYTLIKSGLFNAQLKNTSSGSAQPQLPIKDLKEIELEIPDLPTQKKIAEILSAYDSKIENNNKIIKNFEITAQTIFNEWFINFHFPGHEKVKMIDSEMGEIPEGWEEKPLDEIADFLNGVASQKYPADDLNNSLPVIKIREMNSGIDKNSDKATRNIESKYIIQNGDILFAWSGSLSLMTWVGGEGVLNQHIFKVTSEIYPRWFIYYWTNKHLQNFKTIAVGKATTMGHIQRHHLTESKVIVPDKSILKNANTILEPIFEQQILLQEENISLKNSRDQLLAKLI